MNNAFIVVEEQELVSYLTEKVSASNKCSWSMCGLTCCFIEEKLEETADSYLLSCVEHYKNQLQNMSHEERLERRGAGAYIVHAWLREFEPNKWPATRDLHCNAGFDRYFPGTWMHASPGMNEAGRNALGSQNCAKSNAKRLELLGRIQARGGDRRFAVQLRDVYLGAYEE